jgi:hypothetical protein
MGDDRFYDAINVFKFSPTGIGARPAGGDPASQALFAGLVKMAIDKLWNYWSKGQIKYSKSLVWDATAVELGMSDSGALFINPELEPTNDPAKFSQPGDQALLAIISLTMAHEGIHAASGFRRDLTEEVVCRVIEMNYYQDLVGGLVYTSKFANARCTAQLRVLGNKTLKVETEHRNQLAWHQAGQLVDFVLLNSKSYVDMLTPDWIVKSKSWWGGLRNRKPETKGFYLNALAPKGNRLLSYSDAILEILESIASKQEWQASGADERAIEEGLQSTRFSTRSFNRILKIQKKLGIFLGANEN